MNAYDAFVARTLVMGSKVQPAFARLWSTWPAYGHAGKRSTGHEDGTASLKVDAVAAEFMAESLKTMVNVAPLPTSASA